MTASCLCALLASGCSGKPDDESQDTMSTGGDANPTVPAPPGQECLDNPRYFKERVWGPILQNQCKNCHNSSGVAKDSSLILVGSEWGPTYLDENMRVVEDIARTERDGSSLLLLKPLGDANHGGGEVVTKDSSAYADLSQFVDRIKNPVQCDTSDTPTTTAYDGLGLLNPEQTLRKAALSLAGRLPNDQELAALKSGDADALDQALGLVMHDEAFYDRIVVLFNDFLLTDLYLPGQDALVLLDGDRFPDVQWFSEIEDDGLRQAMSDRTNDAVARENLELIVHILRHHRSFQEILTADYTMVNPFSAKAYGVQAEFIDPLNEDEFVAVKLDGIPHAGLLTSTMFMNRFPTTETNRNRHRAKVLYDFFLATDIEALASRPLDPTSIADHNPTLNTPSCTVCHANIDPMAGALQNWDERGHYKPREEGWYTDMNSPGFGKTVMPPSEAGQSAQWLAKQIVNDKRFAISIVHMVYKMLTGKAPMQEPTDLAAPDFQAKLNAFDLQSASLFAIADNFASNGYHLRDVFKGIIQSPDYRVAMDSAMTPQQSQDLADLGTARFLTPEQLHAKIQSITGYPWRFRVRDSDYLLSSRWYRIFFGGIDSDGVVQRITEPNGIMANVVKRMANEMSCWVTARDFAKPAKERLLFPHAETSFIPKDNNGFSVPKVEEAIRKNLVHLHKRFLGLELTPQDPEINRSYELFVNVWENGQKLLEDESAAQALPNACRHSRDFWTDETAPEDERITYDRDYTIRSWMSVVAYLLSDPRFLHE